MTLKDAEESFQLFYKMVDNILFAIKGKRVKQVAEGR